MRTTKTLNRIIDKIAETKPARLDGRRRARRAVDVVPAIDALPRTTFGKTIDNFDETREKMKKRRDFKMSTDVSSEPSIKTATKPARVKTPRRRQIDPTTCERDYSREEIEFMRALDDYKRSSGRMFPTCSEILEVFKSLGYVKNETKIEQTAPSVRIVTPPRPATPAFLNDENEFSDAELSFA